MVVYYPDYSMEKILKGFLISELTVWIDKKMKSKIQLMYLRVCK